MGGATNNLEKCFQNGNELGSYLHCPQCGSDSVWKDGHRISSGEPTQRFICRRCNFRFSDPAKSKTKNDAAEQVSKGSYGDEDRSHDVAAILNLRFEEVHNKYPLLGGKDVKSSSKIESGQGLNIEYGVDSTRLVCADEAKNLVATETIGTEVAGDSQNTESKLFNYAWYMKKNGYAESTIEVRVRQLRVLVKRGANLEDPESVKAAIAEQEWENKRKINACDAYNLFLKVEGRTWNPPKYNYVRKIPFLPSEQEIDLLINETGPKISAFLLLLKESAIRAGEAHKLRWKDVDFVSKVVIITPEKGSNPRIFKVSDRLLNKLSAIKARNNISDPNRIFSKQLRTTRRVFIVQRTRLATIYNNPRLKQIHFHTLRHWKATQLYHETKDILYVQRFLGHRMIANTMLYIQLEEAHYQSLNDEYTCKVAKTVEDALPLIEAGYTQAAEFDGVKIFKKRK